MRNRASRLPNGGTGGVILGRSRHRTAVGTFVENRGDVIGLAGFAQIVHHGVNFVVVDESAVDPLRYAGAGRQVEHVAVPEQRLGAHLVENGARIDP